MNSKAEVDIKIKIDTDLGFISVESITKIIGVETTTNKMDLDMHVDNAWSENFDKKVMDMALTPLMDKLKDIGC